MKYKPRSRRTTRITLGNRMIVPDWASVIYLTEIPSDDKEKDLITAPTYQTSRKLSDLTPEEIMRLL